MEKSPNISICIPMYNAARFIKDCIDSVLSQSFQDLELLIVDDGSTDNSCDIVNSVRDNRIRLIRNQHDYVGSLNKLLDEAKGKYIARMDADDVMYPNRLAIQYEYMENHPDVDFIGGRMVNAPILSAQTSVQSTIVVLQHQQHQQHQQLAPVFHQLPL